MHLNEEMRRMMRFMQIRMIKIKDMDEMINKVKEEYSVNKNGNFKSNMLIRRRTMTEKCMQGKHKRKF